MECPKCGAQIDKNTLVCPNCKKVLKIVCPDCRTINTQNICKKCGKILVTKCIKCGKINLLKNKACTKCGYSNEISAIQNESNTEDFALIRIDFLNYDQINKALGSNKLSDKFKQNFDRIITKHLETINIRRQILKDGVYIIRFNKVYTFESSAKMAIETALEIGKIISKLNIKLFKKKKIGLRCNLTIMKRKTTDNPNDADKGYQVKILNNTKSQKTDIVDYLQVMTDEDFCDLYSKNYTLENLENTYMNGKMKRFFEINIKNLINIEEIKQEIELSNEDSLNKDAPNYIKEAMTAQENITSDNFNPKLPENYELYTIPEMIAFDDINCVFYNCENINIINNVSDVMQEVPRGITAIKASDTYLPYTLRLLSAVDETGIYQNIIPITCHEDMKYTPYSFFSELVSSVFEYTVSHQLAAKNDFSVFNQVDPNGLIRDLILLNQKEMEDTLKRRDSYYTTFLSLLQSIPDTLIYIENFDKIDEGSLYVLSLLFENFEDINISYLVSYDSNYSLHKKFPFLLSRPYYTEITLLPSETDNIIASSGDFYKNVKSDFYFKKMAKYAMGSSLFMDYCSQYLIESGVYILNGNSIELKEDKTVIIPSTLSQVIQRRLNLLKDNKDLFTFLSVCLIIGARLDMATALSLGYNNVEQLVRELENLGYLYVYNNCIYFPNYKILKDNILEILDRDKLTEICNILLEKVYTQNMPSPVKAFIYDKFDYHNMVVEEYEKLANLDLSLGDISAYLNCSAEIIKKLDKYSSDWTSEELKLYKTSIYENIANNLYEYNPDQIRDLADKTLDGLANCTDKNSFTSLCSRMIQGALDKGEYLYALNLAHKALSNSQGGSIDPTCTNFNMEFLIMSIIHVKILFGIGAFSDCIDIGYNILNVLDTKKIEAMNFEDISKQDFECMLLECMAYIAISNILTFRENVIEFLDIINKLFNFIPKEYDIFIQLQNLIKGEDVVLTEELKGINIFSNIVFYIVNGFTKYKNKPDLFAKEIYKAKRVSQQSYLPNFELLCDLLIGYAYTHLNSFVKASSILNNVVKVSKDKGMNIINSAGLHILGILNLQRNKYETAYGLVKNSNTQIEHECEILALLNDLLMYKILKKLHSETEAQNPLNQAKYIIDKYELKFNLNIDNE